MLTRYLALSLLASAAVAAPYNASWHPHSGNRGHHCPGSQSGVAGQTANLPGNTLPVQSTPAAQGSPAASVLTSKEVRTDATVNTGAASGKTSVQAAVTSAVAPTTPAAQAASGSSPTGSYAQAVVLHHNIHRSNHSAPDIAWSDTLAATAQKIGESCYYAHNTAMDKDSIGGYGQNIAAGVSADEISVIISDMFYNGEVGWYDGLYGQAQPDMSNFEHWGHFSQVVWKSTTKVGCASVDCSAKGLGGVSSGVKPVFTVCNYQSPGNYQNQYGDNVGTPLDNPTLTGSYTG